MFDKVEKAIDDLKKGKLIIVIDDENRENEGDLICAGQYTSVENINFMAKFGRGLICTPINLEIAKKFKLTPMIYENEDNHKTAFSISIDYKTTKTGISAFERSLTIKKLTNPKTKFYDFRKPGHIFPLISKEWGLLERMGHTEATIDLMKLANLIEVGVCCEILGDDGQMLRKEGLKEFAIKHNLTFINIHQIKEYMLQKINLIKMITKTLIPTKWGYFNCYVFEEKWNNKIHFALTSKKISINPFIRIHSKCLTSESFGSLKCDCKEQLDESFELISNKKNGILIYLDQEGRDIGIIEKLKAYKLQEKGIDTYDSNVLLGHKPDNRDYYVAYQILKYFKIEEINLITNNPDKIEQIKNYGIKINKIIKTKSTSNIYNYEYLKTKNKKFKHTIDLKKGVKDGI